MEVMTTMIMATKSHGSQSRIMMGTMTVHTVVMMKIKIMTIDRTMSTEMTTHKMIIPKMNIPNTTTMATLKMIIHKMIIRNKMITVMITTMATKHMMDPVMTTFTTPIQQIRRRECLPRNGSTLELIRIQGVPWKTWINQPIPLTWFLFYCFCWKGKLIL